ncbi:hypothetical protein [Halobellus captivus]|uniref:hypothetical protein n=1 Tax=Halobellus captivus TaxID=2592614 RepID=UPI0011A3D288|nr:hypothetical protein [Halobellus captivus]
MPRLQEADERATITVRVDADLKDQYKSRVDSMSDDLREHVREVVEGDENDPTAVIEDDVLRNGYQALLSAADVHDVNGRRLDVDTATSAIAERTRVPGNAVRDRVLRPLEQLGFVKPRWGSIVILRPEEAVDV